ncbi:LacI family transcriptional regulator [Bacillus paralicheniformis]|uniref:LacI family DNA-binding transcriptional regulator n=1 Tax=Bacillus TaxID=1386 RepID=UPI00095131CA|nr:LacI family DNA-binding transcriptional regulator [Bacillus paralicheniformis]MSN99729.1 LacI family DNA-binding transcriptional regulator [Bacillus paralicheniformis]MSO03737.1 LacI family DNA-binding transcriptional regulator [Bacillus paralicheniformis]MSO07730.1 LacI family DNA-binding transcriptional regulator [Bacillus paralicheniformis]MSO11724.1 LacI family DNA-binding transcriptional regulator [Bacillus paralicheniformis]NJE37123.1 LacI family DNA-binding transcriptional regulator 
MANIREIAEAAGVSITTVSRVLNGHPYVKEEKRQKVLETIERLEYARNMHAVHLSKGFSNMIGVVLPTIGLPYFGDLLEGIAEEAAKEGVHFSLYQTNYQLEKEVFALEQLKQRQVDGLIFCSKAMSDEALLDWHETGPFILCQDSSEQHFSTVSIPHKDAFRLGLDFLIEKGHTKIAIGLARKNGMNSHFRLEAYKEALAAIGEPYREEWVFERSLTITDGQKLFSEWREMKEKPTAVFIANDQVSAGMFLEAQRHQVDIPGSLAILSCDNQPISEVLGISTIKINIKEMGKHAFRLLRKRIGGAGPEKQTVPYKLIKRATV